MGTKPARKQSRISTYDAGTYRWCIVSPSIITFLVIFLNLREPLLSNGSRRFKKNIKKVIIDGETIDHRYVPASYVDILDCFRAGLVPICSRSSSPQSSLKPSGPSKTNLVKTQEIKNGLNMVRNSTGVLGTDGVLFLRQ